MRTVAWSEGLSRWINAVVHHAQASVEQGDLKGWPAVGKVRDAQARRQEKFAEASTHAAKLFARDNGWQLREKRFSLETLADGRTRPSISETTASTGEFDHPDFFWDTSGPAAIVVHDYPGQAPGVLPEGLYLAQLPASWYNPDRTTAYIIMREEIQPPRSEDESHMHTYVKLHQDGKQVAISTNAADEHEFIRGVSDALLKLNGALSTGELEAFLPQVMDICCRMRGYKNTVDERRVLIAGRITPTEESVIASSLPTESQVIPVA